MKLYLVLLCLVVNLLFHGVNGQFDLPIILEFTLSSGNSMEFTNTKDDNGVYNSTHLIPYQGKLTSVKLKPNSAFDYVLISSDTEFAI